MRNEDLDIKNPTENFAKFVRRMIKRREDLVFSIKFGAEEQD